MPNRLNILNIWVDQVSRKDALEVVEGFLHNGNRPHMVFAVNPEKNFSVPRDPLLYESFKNADLLIPDGIGIVAAVRLLYGFKLKRIPGSEFIFDICRICQEKGLGVFVYGAKEDVNQKAVKVLEERFTGLSIVGRSNGYIKEDEMPALIDKINASNARVLFLALGSPIQERWLSKFSNQLESIRVCQGVGGTLDTIASRVRRAPEAWCRMNLEWLYRLLNEPKRIRRQRVLPIFALKVVVEAITKKLSRNVSGSFNNLINQ